eukprot:scaffold948_cov106-Cylindrotheca_fusiformis.AAC.12
MAKLQIPNMPFDWSVKAARWQARSNIEYRNTARKSASAENLTIPRCQQQRRARTGEGASDSSKKQVQSTRE